MTDMAYMGTCPQCGGMTFSADDYAFGTDEREILARGICEEIIAGNNVHYLLAVVVKMHRWCNCAAAAYEIDMSAASEYPPFLDDGARRVVKEARG